MINDIRNFWGNTLRQVTPSKEIKENLPEDTFDFLSTVGLPTVKKLREERERYLRATVPPVLLVGNEQEARFILPYFEFTHEKLALTLFQQHLYITIGNQGDSIIALKAQSGEVYLINGERPSNYPPEFMFYPLIFLNTTIQASIRFLMVDLQYRPMLIEPTVKRIYLAGEPKSPMQENAYRSAKKEIHKVIHQIELEFRAIDERALTEPDSWWRGYLQDLESF